MRPPRALYCEFPLGRPLGKPNDPGFQRGVLEAALRLLGETAGPVLEDFGERITDDAAAALACSLPPRYDAALPPEIDEALGLRAAYDRQLARSGRTTVGRAVDADRIAEAIAAVMRVADGVPPEEAELPGRLHDVGLDVRAYYEEAAIALAEHTPGARQAENWFFEKTVMGATLIRARDALREAGQAESVWRFLVPSPR